MEVETQPRYCYRHPDRETGLSCSECGKSICYECMTPAPVGLRCPEHSGKPQGVRKATVAAERVVTKSGTRPYPVTMVLIAVNVGVFLLELAGGALDQRQLGLDLRARRSLRARWSRRATGGRLITAAVPARRPDPPRR